MQKKLVIYTDGGARGNPGPAAIGVTIDDRHYKEYIGETTNNEAEYRAVIFALTEAGKIVKEKKDEYGLQFFLDSELVVKQLNREYKVKQAHLKVFWDEIQALRAKFKVVTFTHVRREQNKVADKLVNEVLDAL
ncbi:MAG: ribonuclease HI family protein [Candidatus Harrisonbacteria bacterium]|nr:ribonuclease HI family protein [Candidatus Harrisonbacteria bacterium]